MIDETLEEEIERIKQKLSDYLNRSFWRRTRTSNRYNAR